MSPRVLNRKNLLAKNAVYVGRPTKWGNKHKIGRCDCGKNHDRREAVAAFEADLDANPRLLAALPELRGHDLVCWCAPQMCHADVLLRRANQ